MKRVRKSVGVMVCMLSGASSSITLRCTERQFKCCCIEVMTVGLFQIHLLVQSTLLFVSENSPHLTVD